jgi:hypothetical protein
VADRQPQAPIRLISAKAAAGIAAATLILGGIFGVLFDRIAQREAASEPQSGVRGEGTLESLPAGPVDVVAEVVLLPKGFESSNRRGGPTFNFVQRGRVEIENAGVKTVYGPGTFFVEPAGRAHTIRVLENARLDVLRLLPPGVEATTEVG